MHTERLEEQPDDVRILTVAPDGGDLRDLLADDGSVESPDVRSG